MDKYQKYSFLFHRHLYSRIETVLGVDVDHTGSFFLCLDPAVCIDGSNCRIGGFVAYDRMGTLEPGKMANILVLTKNLFEIPVEQIRDTRVSVNYFEGREVYHE